jgi:hypothetical protein
MILQGIIHKRMAFAAALLGASFWLAPPAFADRFEDGYTTSCTSGSAPVQSFFGGDEVVNGVVISGTSDGIPAFGGANRCALPGPDSIPGSFVTATAQALSDVGVVGVSVNTEKAPRFFDGFTEAESSALFSGDYTFSGPQPTITTFMVIQLEGSIDFSCPEGFGCVHELDAELQLTDENFTFTEPGAYDVLLKSKLITLPTGRPIAIGVRLDALARSSTCSFFSTCSTTQTSSVKFLDTLQFNPDGPVFDLPEGFTVNGPCIVDDRFVCGEAGAAVPEPSSFWLLAAGLCAGVLTFKRVRTKAVTSARLPAEAAR